MHQCSRHKTYVINQNKSPNRLIYFYDDHSHTSSKLCSNILLTDTLKKDNQCDKVSKYKCVSVFELETKERV